MIKIPNYKDIDIKYIVCDYNGTIARDGVVHREIRELFAELSKIYKIYVITADTFGSVAKELDGYSVEIEVLSSSDHTNEKMNFVESLGADSVISIGNGNNDKEMLRVSALGIALMGDEGCSIETLMSADIVCKDIREALELPTKPKRIVATLRR